MLHEVLQDLKSYPVFAHRQNQSYPFHEAFEDKKKKVFREPKELVGQYEQGCI